MVGGKATFTRKINKIWLSKWFKNVFETTDMILKYILCMKHCFLFCTNFFNQEIFIRSLLNTENIWYCVTLDTTPFLTSDFTDLLLSDERNWFDLKNRFDLNAKKHHDFLRWYVCDMAWHDFLWWHGFYNADFYSLIGKRVLRLL